MSHILLVLHEHDQVHESCTRGWGTSVKRSCGLNILEWVANFHVTMTTWYMIHDLEAPLPGTNICDPSLQVYIGYQLGSQVVPCNGVSNVSLHYMVVSVIPVSNVISGRMGSQSHSYLILHCVLDTGITSYLCTWYLWSRFKFMLVRYQVTLVRHAIPNLHMLNQLLPWSLVQER